MANVVSGSDITVIVLDNDEANALADLLYDQSHAESGKWALDELANTMLDEKMAFGYEGSCEEGEEGTEIAITPYDAPEPPWKDEPTTDYRIGNDE